MFRADSEADDEGGAQGGPKPTKVVKSQAPIRSPPIRNPRNPWALARESPGNSPDAWNTYGGL
eukprot:6311204-Alexandrium_andersonii.AAC.1